MLDAARVNERTPAPGNKGVPIAELEAYYSGLPVTTCDAPGSIGVETTSARLQCTPVFQYQVAATPAPFPSYGSPFSEAGSTDLLKTLNPNPWTIQTLNLP